MSNEQSVFELAEGTRVQIDGLPYFVKGRAEVVGFVEPNSMACAEWVGESVATNDQVNRDAASVVPTSETTNGGSGASDCSFSAIDCDLAALFSAFWPEFIENLGRTFSNEFWNFSNNWAPRDMAGHSEVADAMVRSLPEICHQTDTLRSLRESLVSYDRDLKQDLKRAKG